jgi:hypothetical protein
MNTNITLFSRYCKKLIFSSAEVSLTLFFLFPSVFTLVPTAFWVFTFWPLPCEALGFYLLAFACEALVFNQRVKTKASQAKAQKGKNQSFAGKGPLVFNQRVKTQKGKNQKVHRDW